MSELKPMSGETLDLTKENIERLKELFPEVLTEDQIDFDKLRLILSDEINDKPEKYSFTWNGKQAAIKFAQQPSTATLRPNKEKSKDWNTTENLYIEGDNLEVLKLLQKSYAGKVKVIYIDPPYNTGKDFVYKDNFKDNIQNYFEQTGQVDSEGDKFSTNVESSGRFHTDWLNMIYPRLMLLKNLLTDDGVIFVSIDDNESENLKKLLDEVFGYDNRLSTHHIQVRYAQKSLNERKDFQELIEQVYIYAKDKHSFVAKKPTEEYKFDSFNFEIKELSEPDDHFRANGKDVDVFLPNSYEIITHNEGNYELFKETWISGSIYSGTGHGTMYQRVVEPRIEKDGLGVVYKIHGIGEDGLGYRYYTGPQREGATRGKMFTKLPLDKKNDYLEGKLVKEKTINNFYDFSAEFGNIRHEGSIAFNSGKKPVKMIKQFINYTYSEDAIILDVFSGSASTAHAVMELNSEDNGNRKYIMVQLPEKTEVNSDAYKAGYKTISELGISRIDNVIDSLENSDIDKGYKVFYLEDSNIKKWNVDSENLEESLFSMHNNFVEGRSHADIVYEVLLKLGLDLNTTFEESTVDDSTVYDVALGNIYVVLGDNITQEVANYIADKQKDYENENPSVVFNDNGFASDNEKLNSVEILKNNGFNEEQLMSI